MFTELFNAIYGQDRQTGMPRIAIGVLTNGARGACWVLLDEEGRVVRRELDEFVADIRFRDGAWIDVSPTE